MPENAVIVFVHGWSVTNTDTYGGLPVRLRCEAEALKLNVRIEELFLGRYISFHDEVRLSDISRAFRTALADELSDLLQAGTRFVCITHSTGGPVVRDWWHRYYESDPQAGICPMSHLIMLAPANFGSALAQLGKGRLSRLKSWFEGVEPGQGVLDWLELGSSEAWELNSRWITSDGSHIGPDGIFPFVLTGQSIDRSFYDNLNSYTGESGSDGVVRVAAAHLGGTYLKLVQEAPQPVSGQPGVFSAQALNVGMMKRAPETALRVIGGKSHSGETMGIMRSVAESLADTNSRETVYAILACTQVRTDVEYMALCQQFRVETESVQKRELLEVERHLFRSDVNFIHDRYAMVMFRVRDDEGHPVTDYDLILTAGPEADPNHLPQGFFADRQRNSLNPEVITYFLNRDVMKGAPAVIADDGTVIRPALPGAGMLGFKLIARPDCGFVHYLPCEITATEEMLEQALHANSTTLVDIVLRRVVRKNVFRVERVVGEMVAEDFSGIGVGDEVVG